MKQKTNVKCLIYYEVVHFTLVTRYDLTKKTYVRQLDMSNVQQNKLKFALAAGT